MDKRIRKSEVDSMARAIRYEIQTRKIDRYSTDEELKAFGEMYRDEFEFPDSVIEEAIKKCRKYKYKQLRVSKAKLRKEYFDSLS